jgi:hypothetical protein
MHSPDLIKQGLAIEKLVLVQAWREAGSLFDIRERSALAWTETAGAATAQSGGVSSKKSGGSTADRSLAGV